MAQTNAKPAKAGKNPEKQAYLERKEKLLTLEKGNWERIIFMRGTGGYWMLAGHSAVIFANQVAPELKIRVVLRKDTDFDHKSKEGVILLKNVEFYKTRLLNSGQAELEKAEENFILCRLKRKMSETEYDLLRRSKEIRRQKLEGMILKNSPMPKLNQGLTDTLKLTYKFYNKHSEKIERGFILDKLVDSVRMAHKAMLLAAREETPREEALKRIKRELSMALCDLQQVSLLEIWSVEDCTTLSIKIIETIVLVEEEEKKGPAPK